MNADSASHRMVQIPADKTVGDFLPQFSDVKQEHGPIGVPCKLCASCSKPFTAARKPRLTLKLYPSLTMIPLSFLYSLCGRCTNRYRASDAQRDQVLAAVEKFVMGDGQSA